MFNVPKNSSVVEAPVPTAKSPSKRNIKPRSAIVVESVSLTQFSEPVTGMPAGRWCHYAGKVYAKELGTVRIGKLVIVRRDRWEALLVKLADAGVDEPFPEPSKEPAPVTSDTVLARLGLRACK